MERIKKAGKTGRMVYGNAGIDSSGSRYFGGGIFFPDTQPCFGEQYFRIGHSAFQFFPLSISAITMILNVILFGDWFLYLRKDLWCQDGLHKHSLPVFLGIFERILPDNQSMTGSAELDVVCYIFVVSIGLSILFNRNASSGGLDIVAKIMNKYLHMELGKAMSLSGMCVALSSALIYDKRR